LEVCEDGGRSLESVRRGRPSQRRRSDANVDGFAEGRGRRQGNRGIVERRRRRRRGGLALKTKTRARGRSFRRRRDVALGAATPSDRCRGDNRRGKQAARGKRTHHRGPAHGHHHQPADEPMPRRSGASRGAARGVDRGADSHVAEAGTFSSCGRMLDTAAL